MTSLQSPRALGITACLQLVHMLVSWVGPARSDDQIISDAPAALVASTGESAPVAELEPVEEVGPPRLEIDLPAALALAAGDNPQVAFAQARIREAFARHDAAKALWLPSLRAGVSWNKHEGIIQDVEGNLFDASRGSVSAGLGARAVGAGSPAIPGLAFQFHASDAVFQPRVTGYTAAARQSAARATTNDILLATAIAYLQFLRAAQQHAIAKETLNNAEQLAEVTASFAKTGQGLASDADRLQAELAIRKNELLRAEEGTRVAAYRLAELLHLMPEVEFVPKEASVTAIDMVAPEMPLKELLATGLSERPELDDARNLVCAAVNRLRREKYAPILPSMLLGISYGGFGGGTGSTISNYRERLDVDASAYWEIRNFGFGERAARAEARSQVEQARHRQVALMDQVAREIAEAHAQVTLRQQQVATAETGIQSASDSYRRNSERIRQGQGLPIEVLQAIQALDLSRREYLRATVEYNEAQFRLQRAIGWPIQ